MSLKTKTSSKPHICPYVGWDLYFNGCPPEDFTNLYEGIDAWIEFFSSKYAIPVVQVCAVVLVFNYFALIHSVALLTFSLFLCLEQSDW